VDILFILVPISVLMVLGIIAVLAWAFSTEQFDHLDVEGERILDLDQDRKVKKD
jgi:cbb3-type cytochrome oxidase maturation protein